MPSDGSFSFTVGSERVEDVQFSWGVHHNPVRRGDVGWGISVELPAVIEMIGLVAQESASAEELRQRLLRLAEEIRVEYDEPSLGLDDEPVSSAPWGSDCPAACAVCSASKPDFEARQAEVNAQRERLAAPDSYPFAAGTRTLHRSVCRDAQTAGNWEAFGAWNAVQAQRRLLREFAHHDNRGPDMRVLTADEAAEWVRRRIGPRGGMQYRLCRLCSPESP